MFFSSSVMFQHEDREFEEGELSRRYFSRHLAELTATVHEWSIFMFQVAECFQSEAHIAARLN